MFLKKGGLQDLKKRSSCGKIKDSGCALQPKRGKKEEGDSKQGQRLRTSGGKESKLEKKWWSP